jgi:hypothetical protein
MRIERGSNCPEWGPSASGQKAGDLVSAGLCKYTPLALPTWQLPWQLHPPIYPCSPSLAFSPAVQIYSASLDGTIALWDLQDGSLVQRYTVGEPIESMVVVPSPSGQSPASPGRSSGGAGLAFLTTHWRDQQTGRVACFDLSGAGRLHGERAKVSAPRQLAASASGRHVALVERHSVMVWATTRFCKRPLTLHHTRALTCVAIR